MTASDTPKTAPENREQADEDTQAQTVAGEAMTHGSAPDLSGEDSEHGGAPNPAQIIPDDTQDVVDHMEQMERSGVIDMDAYRGERSDDDEPGMLGEDGLEPGDFDDNGRTRTIADDTI
ncbi:hypothetical protein [Sphingorhabdus contaminans]|jgi:hypothetical protein|uniref:Uncharacterized protein n=1 Tax=Sphingorhabdus contaminans TaxID=1343899 RepID=A0A553W9E1_9SPHN|nr:hypothetical protein [Sphingorhabdus contaminans]TSB01315.1 hypothetical protein FOM92_08850 [Sphingorhabdus contaminans]